MVAQHDIRVPETGAATPREAFRLRLHLVAAVPGLDRLEVWLRDGDRPVRDAGALSAPA